MDSPAPKNWWSRNWKWFVPVGCLGSLVACVGFVAILVAVIFGMIKSSDAYTESVAKARSDPAVKNLLGEPIEPGFWLTGRIQVSGASGNADLAIPLSGPKGSATLYVIAKKVGGKWEYSTMEVAPDGGGQRVDLMAKPEKVQ